MRESFNRHNRDIPFISTGDYKEFSLILHLRKRKHPNYFVDTIIILLLFILKLYHPK